MDLTHSAILGSIGYFTIFCSPGIKMAVCHLLNHLGPLLGDFI